MKKKQKMYTIHCKNNNSIVQYLPLLEDGTSYVQHLGLDQCYQPPVLELGYCQTIWRNVKDKNTVALNDNLKLIHFISNFQKRHFLNEQSIILKIR